MSITSWLEQRRSTWLVVGPWQAALVSADGAPVTVLGPGRHRVPAEAWTELVELREQAGELGLQEIPAADGIGVKVSLMYRWQVTDPLLFRQATGEPERALHQSLQVALRELTATIAVEQVAETLRSTAGPALVSAVRPAMERYGIALLSVDVRDVLLPAEVRVAQTAVLTARLSGQAKLEAARGETAALRALANAAAMLAENPALAQLRLVQELPVGSTVELRP